MTTLPPDQPARDRIAGRDPADLRATFVVRAAAGTGKTSALVGRMAALVAAGVPVDQLVAITFTRKAAGEMRARFFARLAALRDELAAAGAPEAARRPVEAALDRVDACFIDTIHAFCARLLRERPLEAGLSPDFVQVEDREEQQLRRRAWRRYLAERVEAAPRVLDELAELGLAPADLYDFFGDLCRFEDLEPFAEDAPRPDLEAPVAEARAFLQAWQARRPAAPPAGRDRDAAQRAFNKAEHVLRYRGLHTDGDRAAFLALFDGLVRSDGRADVTLNRWGDTKEAKALAAELRDTALPGFVAAVVAPALAAWRAYVYERLVAFVRPAVERYAEYRRAEGRLTFQDLLLHAARLLRDHADVRAFFQDRFRYLLVDEFQDTDPVQAEILFYLADPDRTTETDWTRLRPAPGRLFIVGDDQQSIYRFRRADVDVFRQVTERVVEAGGEVLALTTNFRSLGRVCAWCNDVFAPLFARPDVSGCQAAYQPLVAYRADAGVALPIRQIVVDKVARNDARAIAEAEAERIAAFIDGACAGDDTAGPGRKARYGDFMVLARLSARLPVYARALARRGIPFTLAGSRALGASEELRALVDLLACVLKPDDAVAQVAYLRGLLAGLGDDQLYRYRTAGGTFGDAWATTTRDRTTRDTTTRDTTTRDTAARPVPPGLSPEDTRAFATAFGHLHRARVLLEARTPSAALEALLDELGLLAAAAHREPGSLRAGNLLKALALVRRLEAQEQGWAEIFEALQALLDGEAEAEEMTLETGAADAVRLMNVHQAKGLEASVVFLADPYDPHDPTTRLGPDFHVSRRGDHPVVVVPAVRRSTFASALAAPRAWAETFAPAERRFLTAEAHRLLYVAATRARDLLVVSRYAGAPDRGFWSEFFPLLDQQGAAELTVLPEAPREAVYAPLPDVAALRAERERRLAAAAAPAYRRASTASDAAEAASMLDAFRASPAGQALRASGEVYAAVPFACRDDAETPPRLVRGTFDLVYRADGGYHLVAFVAGPDAHTVPAARVEQVLRQARYWQLVTGTPVATAGLWVAAAGRYVDVALPRPGRTDDLPLLAPVAPPPGPQPQTKK